MIILLGVRGYRFGSCSMMTTGLAIEAGAYLIVSLMGNDASGASLIIHPNMSSEW